MICGLGNPGRKYRFTRHNIGFLFLEYIQKELDITFLPGDGSYDFCHCELAEHPVVFIQPLTYMNLSGIAVVEALEDFQVKSSDLLIIYDDYHLPFGELRFRKKGSSGGHNGIKSIIDHLDTKLFDRLKVGIVEIYLTEGIDQAMNKFNRNVINPMGTN
ncbi:MAG: aminoacyl-tRNA hydrolase [Calditrichaceae bacterium]